MAGSVKRRDFIKTASLLGTSIAVANPASAGSFLTGNTDRVIRNDYFSVSMFIFPGIIHGHGAEAHCSGIMVRIV